jgi:hypothetical protein
MSINTAGVITGTALNIGGGSISAGAITASSLITANGGITSTGGSISAGAITASSLITANGGITSTGLITAERIQSTLIPTSVDNGYVNYQTYSEYASTSWSLCKQIILTNIGVYIIHIQGGNGNSGFGTPQYTVAISEVNSTTPSVTQNGIFSASGLLGNVGGYFGNLGPDFRTFYTSSTANKTLYIMHTVVSGTLLCNGKITYTKVF